jgi:hypothetical protein
MTTQTKVLCYSSNTPSTTTMAIPGEPVLAGQGCYIWGDYTAEEIAVIEQQQEVDCSSDYCQVGEWIPVTSTEPSFGVPGYGDDSVETHMVNLAAGGDEEATAWCAEHLFN